MYSRVHFTRNEDGSEHSALFASRMQAIQFVTRINREGWGMRFRRREDNATRAPGETLHRSGYTAVHHV